MGSPVEREQSNTLVSLRLKEVHLVMDGETSESQHVIYWVCCGSPSSGIMSPQSLRVEGSRSEEQGSYGCGNNEDSPRETSARQLNSIAEYVEYMASRELCQGPH